MSDPFPPLSSDFPPPREDEPRALRQDIVDELADHLACALHRERHRTGDEEQARKNVLTRFGNPAQVAARLWREAMWEKIMSQRLILAAATLATFACMGLLAYFLSSNQQLLQSQQQATQSLLEQMQRDAVQDRASYLAALQQMNERLAEARQSQAPSEWNPVEFKFVRGSEDGPPAEGVTVGIALQMGTATAEYAGLSPPEATSDARGVVRFPHCRYGNYSYLIRDGEESTSGNFSLSIGQGMTKAVVCRAEPLQPLDVQLRFEWPKDLQNAGLWWSFGAFPLVRQERELTWSLGVGAVPSGANWSDAFKWGTSLPKRNPWRDMGFAADPEVRSILFNNYGFSHPLLVAPNGTVHLIQKVPQFLQASMSGMGGMGGRSSGRSTVEQSWAFDEPGLQVIRWPGQQYRIGILTVLIPQVGSLADAVAADRTGAIAEKLATDARFAEEARGNPQILTDMLQSEDVEARKASSPARRYRIFDIAILPNAFAGSISGSGFVDSVSFDQPYRPAKQRLEPGNPATLWITPSEEMVNQVRAMLKARDEKASQQVEETGTSHTITLRFIQDAPGRPPMAGVRPANVSSIGGNRAARYASESNADGKLTLQQDGFRPQRFQVSARLPWGDVSLDNIDVEYADNRNVDVLVPPPPQPAKLQFHVERPQEFPTEGLLYEVGLLLKPQRIGETSWQAPRLGSSATPLKLLVSAEGQIIGAVESEAFISFSSHFDLKLTTTPEFRSGDYVLRSFRAVRKVSGAKPATGDFVIENITSEFTPPEESMTFSAKPGDQNVWQIKLPDFVWRKAHDAPAPPVSAGGERK